MPTISSIYQPLRNNPLASVSTGATVIGVAIAAIGILSLVGIVPGISSITAICLIAGGGTIATIGTLGMLKGFILTWPRVRSITSHSESNKTWEVKDFGKIEEKLVKQSKALNANVYAKISAMWEEGGVVFTYYCLYDPKEQTHTWYELNATHKALYHVKKKNKDLPWVKSNLHYSENPVIDLDKFIDKIENFKPVAINDDLPTFDAIISDADFCESYLHIGDIMGIGNKKMTSPKKNKTNAAVYVVNRLGKEIGGFNILIGVKDKDSVETKWYVCDQNQIKFSTGTTNRHTPENPSYYTATPTQAEEEMLVTEMLAGHTRIKQ